MQKPLHTIYNTATWNPNLIHLHHLPYSYLLVTPRSSMTLPKPIVPIPIRCKTNLILPTVTSIQARSASSFPMKTVEKQILLCHYLLFLRMDHHPPPFLTTVLVIMASWQDPRMNPFPWCRAPPPQTSLPTKHQPLLHPMLVVLMA